MDALASMMLAMIEAFGEGGQLVIPPTGEKPGIVPILFGSREAGFTLTAVNRAEADRLTQRMIADQN